MDDELKLIGQQFVKNEYGIEKPVPTEKTVMVKKYSVTRSEFFLGGRNGLNPVLKFEMNAAEYDGESVCEYRGNKYAIYRVFQEEGSDYIELYVERKGGLNNAIISA